MSGSFGDFFFFFFGLFLECYWLRGFRKMRCLNFVVAIIFSLTTKDKQTINHQVKDKKTG